MFGVVGDEYPILLYCELVDLRIGKAGVFEVIDEMFNIKQTINSKVAGARFPEWEYAQKALENQGLLWMLEGCQTPIDTGANPCGDAHASLATSTTFSSPSSPFSAVRKPGTL